MSTMNIFDLTDTWNAGGTTFTAIKMNATDTASAAGSLLIDLQVGGVSQFSVTKAGAVTAVGVAIPTISSTSTLTNKTLSSPTLSGTVSGAASWSAKQTFLADMEFNIGAVRQIEQVATNAHAAGNVGSLTLGIRDGSLCSGVRINNTHNGTFSSQSIDFLTAEGGVSNTTVRMSITSAGTVVFPDAGNIAAGTTTGTKIGTATSQKLGFFNQTPVVQPTAVADATTAVDVITQFNALLTRMRNLGLIAT